MKLFIAHIHSSDNNGVCTGHFMPVAAMYDHLFSDICDVYIAGGPLYLQRFKKDKLLSLPYSVALQSPSVVSLCKMVINAWTLFKRTKGHTVVIQDSKPFSNHICVLLCYRRCNLYLIKYHTDGVNTPLKKIIYSLIKHRIKGIICPNDSIGQAHQRPYCVVPDYIYYGDDCQSRNTSDTEKKYDFCCLGRIVPEKGMIDVVKKLKNTRFKLLIAGNPTPSSLADELRSLCQNSTNIDLKLGYLSDSDYENYLNDSKYAFMNYQGTYANRSSGVVFDMIFHDIPVIGTQCAGLHFVEEEKVGYLYHDLNSLDLESFFNEKTYTDYLQNIQLYRKKHQQYRKKLASFLGLS